MNKLGDRNYSLISQGVKSAGSYNPNEIFCYFEEQLYMNESEEIEKFLQWVHDNGKHFGHGNYEKVFAEFKEVTGDKLFTPLHCPKCDSDDLHYKYSAQPPTGGQAVFKFDCDCGFSGSESYTVEFECFFDNDGNAVKR